MDTNEIVIEQVTTFSPEVADGVRALVKQLGENASPLTDDDLRELIKSPSSFLFIAKDSITKQTAGMIFLAVYRIPYTQKAYIDDVIVDEAFRKRGIATQLLNKAITIAKENNATYVEFTSNPQRAAGNKLYEKLGFQKRETNIYRFYIT